MTTSTLMPMSVVTPVGGWTIEHRACVDSTQTAARGRPPWHAVVAEEQTAGRGQATRTFSSEPGGLYLTAVLPYASDPFASRGFALAVGWSVREFLCRAGVRRLRLRWPNDLMVGARKVGGILVEQGGPDTLLVGIGLNITNRPWLADPSLHTIAGRLVDATDGAALPAHRPMAEMILQAIRLAHDTFVQRHLAGFVTILNRTWGPPRLVDIEPAGGLARGGWHGLFRGVDREGRVLLRTGAGQMTAIPAHQIGRLREVL